MDAAADRLPKLPACQLCYQKKIKCDSTRPKCTPCAKNGSECVVLNSPGDELLSRAEIDRLEQREKILSARLRDEEVQPSGLPACSQPTLEAGRTIASIENSHVSQGEGLGFMASLFTDPDLRRNNSELLHVLASVPNATGPQVEPCDLPGMEEAEILFEKYLSWSHVQCPFLCRGEVKALLDRVSSSTPPGSSVPDHDLFRAFMILAVGSVFPYRNGTHSQHPEGYYMAALRYMGMDLLTRGLDSIQDLLLVCRFGIYHRIGTSIWDKIRLCGRLCVEQGLHLDESDSKNLLRAQMKRRVFWQFYMIDRYSSTLLGKPFAIDDRDIEASFPADADDEDLITASQSAHDLGAFQLSHVSLGPNEMTVFFTSVRLRQITSRIHTEFSRLARNHSDPSQIHLAPGYIYTAMSRLIHQLEQWRENCPVFREPRCLFESQGWYDLLLAREKLYLVRRAIDIVPKREGKTPRHVSVLCLKTALRTIQVYSDLCQNRPLITHTRSYFHMMFTAGLCVMFCVSSSSALEREDIQQANFGLTQCEETLRDMIEQLRSARHYVIVFEALRRNTSRKLSRIMESLSSERSSSATTGQQWPSVVSPESPWRPARSFMDSGSAHLHNSTNSDVRGASGEETQVSNDATVAQFNFAFHHNSDSTNQLFAGGANYPSFGIPDDFSPGSELFDWAFLNDETLWNMETVLGEYVYGDPNQHAGIPDNFDIS
ncbi:Zn(II)2Cys6 transcription factor [Colletotrichum plurivorum]|uniref:Zn(II)2Cys6 transcription factor n=1 Tax=Colletotrichum plurivorum TaxID=2175906 RepID=A0A8H6MZ62_9PEZI|nr:Zn(II)2Cys6 transcription factor [Colletotrichum plurivorum]